MLEAFYQGLGIPCRCCRRGDLLFAWEPLLDGDDVLGASYL